MSGAAKDFRTLQSFGSLGPRKRVRTVIAAVVVAAAVVAALVVARSGPPGFATPADCLDAYADACRSGDADRYLTCLNQALRDQVLRRYPEHADLAEAIRQSMKNVKSWVQTGDPKIDEAAAELEVDQVLPNGTRRLRFRLEKSGSSWRIAGIDGPKDVPTLIPFGTHIRDAP